MLRLQEPESVVNLFTTSFSQQQSWYEALADAGIK